MITTENFPTDIEASAFRMHDENAWQRKDLKRVFNHCIEASIAIIGGEAWVVRRIDDCGPDEPTEPQHNLDPSSRTKGAVLARSQTHVIYGILSFRDGQTGVFSWDCPPRQSKQPWQEYVRATVKETARIIENGRLELEVIDEHSAHVYYNLAFQREDGTSF